MFSRHADGRVETLSAAFVRTRMNWQITREWFTNPSNVIISQPSGKPGLFFSDSQYVLKVECTTGRQVGLSCGLYTQAGEDSALNTGFCSALFCLT